MRNVTVTQKAPSYVISYHPPFFFLEDTAHFSRGEQFLNNPYLSWLRMSEKDLLVNRYTVLCDTFPRGPIEVGNVYYYSFLL